ncbi:MAG TPA: phosphoribosylformylglycinamidine synthase I [bacterium (Candidatus Stahlbacteria)]|nr:phosphoribosylformylglycinamidine synthase I [Candidatus Stahlbacteria bacterium]
MKRPKVLILRTAGTNCDLETGFAFENCGAEVAYHHIATLRPNRLEHYQIFVLPGGFTYGDYIGAGKILANELLTQFRDELIRFIEEKKLIIGICNGSQVLVKSGLLPASEEYFKIEATLIDNKSGRFEDRWVFLKPSSSNCIFLKGLDGIIELPVAHAEGRFIAPDRVIERLQKKKMIALRYCNPDGSGAIYPYNPNGSIFDIAGVCDSTGQIFGLMPHPERFIDPSQHPRHNRRKITTTAGFEIIKRGVDYARETF